jgi:hypothetical protein
MGVGEDPDGGKPQSTFDRLLKDYFESRAAGSMSDDRTSSAVAWRQAVPSESADSGSDERLKALREFDVVRG